MVRAREASGLDLERLIQMLSLEAACSFGTSCFPANPCQRLRGFADRLAELLTARSLIQLSQKEQVSKARPFTVFKLSESRFGGDGRRAAMPVALPVRRKA